MTEYTTNEKNLSARLEDNEKGDQIKYHDGPIAIVNAQDSRFGEYLARARPSPFSKSLLKLYPILFVAFMNSAANGFDGNTFGGVSALTDFQDRFGTNVAASDGFLAAIYILGMT